TLGKVRHDQVLAAAFILGAAWTLVGHTPADTQDIVPVVGKRLADQANRVVLRRIPISGDDRGFALEMIAADRRAGLIDLDATELARKRHRRYRGDAADLYPRVVAIGVVGVAWEPTRRKPPLAHRPMGRLLLGEPDREIDLDPLRLTRAATRAGQAIAGTDTER